MSYVRSSGSTKKMFEYQAPAVLNRPGATVVQNTWYDILPATANAWIYGIGVNIEDANETLEVRAIIDGQTTGSIGLACTHSTEYGAYKKTDAISGTVIMDLTTINAALQRTVEWGGHTVQIQVRKTTAAGAGNLTGVVEYGVLRNV